MKSFEELKALLTEIEVDAKKVDAGNKAAGTRFRKATFQMAALLKQARAESTGK